MKKDHLLLHVLLGNLARRREIVYWGIGFGQDEKKDDDDAGME